MHDLFPSPLASPAAEDASFTLLAQKSKPLLISACCEKVAQISSTTENVTKTCQCTRSGEEPGWCRKLAKWRGGPPAKVRQSVSSMQNRMSCKDSDKCPTLAGEPEQKKWNNSYLCGPKVEIPYGFHYIPIFVGS